MKKLKLTVAAALIGISFNVVAPASAAVLTFDDLGSGQAFFLNDYNGFQFGTNSIATTAWFHTDEPSSYYKPVSGSNYIATDFQLYTSAPYTATQAISRSTDFVFNGAYFSGDSTIAYQLYLGGSLIYTSSPSVGLTSTPAYVASGYNGAVDSVVIVGHQGYYGLDNFTYSEVATSAAVPEPASWGMFIGGFALIGLSMRRKTATVSFA